MLTNLKITLAVLCLTAFVKISEAQPGTLEFTSLSSNNVTVGPTTAPVVATFREDIQNLTVNTHFRTNAPAITATFSFARQRFNGTYASNVSTGMTFGSGSTAAVGGNTQVALANPVYYALGGNLIQPPQNGMFVSSPTGTAVLNWQLGGRGVGLDPEGTQNGTDDDNFGSFDYNWGTAIYTTVEPLKDSLKDGRYYYGDLVIKFSRKVKDVVVHFGGLGGSYEYVNLANQVVKAYFSTELELANNGQTSTFLAGNEYFNVVSATNKVLNSAPFPNGGSYSVGAGTNYGAATGSVRVNGAPMDSLVYRVYVRGSVNSQFSFSALQAVIAGATRNPFNGDLFYVAISMNKTQQISGNVLIDAQTTDNNINQSFGSDNPRTSIGGLLYANLISGGLVVATVPISVNGDYLFDNVPVGTYTVDLSTIQGTVGSAPPARTLPSGWNNTGEFIGSGAGTDGLINGASASITVGASDVITNVNFGIKTFTCQSSSNVLFINNVVPKSGYFGGLSLSPASANFFPTMSSNDASTFIYAQTPLAAANYGVVGNTTAFSGTLDPFNAIGDSANNKMMVVNPTATNQTVYYLVDSARRNANNFQTYFKCGRTINFSGFIAKTTSADAVVRIKIYDADDVTRVFADQVINLTGGAGGWTKFEVLGAITCPPPPNNITSPTKKYRCDIISVDGDPFSIDEVCLLPPPLPLPITLSDFTVSKSGCTANLVWKTSQESNSDRFEVEVSTGNNPVYAAAGTVLAAGNSTETKTYRFSYPMKDGEVYYFRIKMIDKDGSFTYSTIKSENCSKGNGGIVIWPNPTIDIFTVRNMQDGKNKVQVFAANGQLVKEQDINQTQGDINIAHLAPGMYTVKITNLISETSVVKKLIKY